MSPYLPVIATILCGLLAATITIVNYNSNNNRKVLDKLGEMQVDARETATRANTVEKIIDNDIKPALRDHDSRLRKVENVSGFAEFAESLMEITKAAKELHHRRGAGGT